MKLLKRKFSLPRAYANKLTLLCSRFGNMNGIYRTLENGIFFSADRKSQENLMYTQVIRMLYGQRYLYIIG